MNRTMLVLGLQVAIAVSVNAQEPGPRILRIRENSYAPSPVRLTPRGAPNLTPRFSSDSVRQQTYWQNGWWTGVAVGALLGTLISVGNTEGYPHTFSEKVMGSLVAGAAIGVPLGVIGGLIGNSFKKPTTTGP